MSIFSLLFAIETMGRLPKYDRCIKMLIANLSMKKKKNLSFELFMLAAGLNYFYDNQPKAKAICRMLAKWMDNVLRAATFFANSDQFYVLSQIRPRIGFLATILQDEAEDFYDFLSNYRGFLLRCRRGQAFLASQTKSTRMVWEKLNSARWAYAQKALSGKEQAKVLREKIALYERRLAKLAPQALAEREHFFITTRKLQEKLPADAVVVDYFFYYNIAKRADCLAVFIVGKQGIKRIELGKAEPIEQAIEKAYNLLKNPRPWPREIYCSPEKSPAKLAALIWRPIARYLSGKHTIYLIPDGNLAKIPFEALPIDAASYLCHQYQVLYLTSPGDLVEHRSELANGLLIVGDIDYGKSTESPGEKYAALPGAEQEMKMLEKLYKGRQIQKLSQKKATVSALRRQAHGYRYIHLATHGYFDDSSALIPQTKFPAYLTNNRISVLFGQLFVLRNSGSSYVNAMLHSGIVLAGANLAAKSNEQDGILTAEELATFDLKRSELLVLSACETGIGSTIQGQGIAGLRMAAYATGVRYFMVSLWRVGDKDTEEFMRSFYRNLWQRRLPAPQALIQAKREWIERERREGQCRVYAWAPFVLSGR